MPSKKSATCEEIGCDFTSFGISQPTDGSTIQICKRCKRPIRFVSTENMHVEPKPESKAQPYQPPVIDAEPVSLFDLTDITMTDEGRQREERKARRKAQKRITA